MSRVVIFAVLMAAAFTVSQVAADVGGELKWCLVSAAEASVCQNMSSIFQRLDPNNHTWSCFLSDSKDACLTALANGEADLTAGDSGVIVKGYKASGVAVVAQEQNAAGGADYWSVAVIRAQDCGEKTTIQDFKGKNTCHTGYRRTAGWNIPVYTMVVKEEIVPKVNLDVNVNNDMESMEAYFGSICAPGTSTGGQICSLCPNACEGSTSAYGDYSGTINCLMNGGGDIAFTKQGIPQEYASDGSSNQTWSILPASELKLLCASGGCKDLNAYESCNFGVVPGEAVIARKDLPAEKIMEAIEVFNLANSDAEFVDLFLNGANTESLIFNSDFIRFQAVYPTSTAEYVGDMLGVSTDVTGLDTTVALGTSAGSSVHASFHVVVMAIFAILFLW